MRPRLWSCLAQVDWLGDGGVSVMDVRAGALEAFVGAGAIGTGDECDSVEDVACRVVLVTTHLRCASGAPRPPARAPRASAHAHMCTAPAKHAD